MNLISPPPKFTIAYADDHQLVREAISNYINGFNNFRVTHTAGNGKQLMENIDSRNLPDIVILDIDMPVLNGYDTARLLKIKYPNIKILILTVFDNEIVRSLSFSCGADVFCSKDISPQEIEHTLIKLLTVDSKPTHHKDSGIVVSEQIFLTWICSDKTYEEIADLMNISLRQVERMRASLFEKLEINNRTSLAVYAIANGLVTS